MAFSECNALLPIDVECFNGVATVLLNQPDKRNALSKEMLLALSEFLRNTANDFSIRVVVLRGKSGFFSAGADLTWMHQAKAQTIHENIDDAKIFYRLFQLLNNYPKPVVAIVEGGAFGGAMGLIACADMVIATQNTQFSFSEVKLGLVPATIAPFVVAKIGHSAARRFMISSEVFTANDALQIGLIHHIALAEKIDESLALIIQRLLQNGPEAMATTKQLLNKLVDSSDDHFHLEGYVSQLIASSRASDEGQEGVAAFFDKRLPFWTKA